MLSATAGDAVSFPATPLSIKPGSYTVPAMFRSCGYVTGFVGKWHLGLGTGGQSIAWNGQIKPGPEEIGFDETFYFPATGDRVPTVFVRNHHVVNLDPKDPITINYKHRIGNEPTGVTDPDLATVLRGSERPRPLGCHHQRRHPNRLHDRR